MMDSVADPMFEIPQVARGRPWYLMAAFGNNIKEILSV